MPEVLPDDDGMGEPSSPVRKRGKGYLIPILVLLLIVAVVLIGQLTRPGAEGIELTYGELWQLIRKEHPQYVLEKAVMRENGDSTEVRFVLSSKEGQKEYKARVAGVGSFHEALDKALVESLGDRYDKVGPSPVLPFLISLAPWVILIFLFWFFFLRQMRIPGGGNVLSFGKSRARVGTQGKRKVTFADVAGIEEAKEEVGEIIEFLKNPQRFQRIGARIPRGVLLVGPPGCGKTLLARAIAGEADRPFFSISGSDFVEMFVGVGASRVRDLFRQAKDNSPCIVFLDEIDAVGRRRGTGLGGGHDEREQTLNAILVEMDGFDTDEGIITIAATNRPDVLDPALLRPGRFDREIVIDLPDVKGREEILEVHARKVKMAPDLDYGVVARSTPMFSGADLESLINEAALAAVMKNREVVTLDDLEEARDKVMWGRQKRSRVMDEEDKRITAFHEAGHALLLSLLPDAEPLHKVTIIPRGAALGSTMNLPKKDRYHVRRSKVLTEIKGLFGGRAAEKVFFRDVTAGAANDIKRASELARLMVTQWGMSEALGPVSYSDAEEHLFLGREISRTTSRSEATAEIIDREVKAILEACFAESEDLVTRHRAELERIAAALMKHEVLTGDEVRGILGGQDVDALKAAAAKPSKPSSARVPAAEPVRAGPAPGLTEKEKRALEERGAVGPAPG
ncbi:MAG: ATP-dependent zinc metalloprotease FtsH [Planctomycetes bacterium]|jgi:cell division protease FtsH|nr:ATP-dependent zinc metalloprotease FtsH [Planctomycetota bacterium]